MGNGSESDADDVRREAITRAWEAVKLQGLTEPSESRSALITELTKRGVENVCDRELDGLVGAIHAPARNGLRMLGKQAVRIAGLFRELRTYAEPKWGLPPRGIPAPPEPDLSSVELAVRLTARELAEARAVIERVINDFREHGNDTEERHLTPWLSAESSGRISVHVGGELIAVLDKHKSLQFHAAIDRWGRGTRTLSVHATLFGVTANTAELNVFVNVPATA